MELLTNKSIKLILKQARMNLERDKYLAPVIFAKLDKSGKDGRDIVILPVELPEADHADKSFRLYAMGEALRRSTGKKIIEAVYIADAYMAQVDKKNAKSYDNSIPVREQPNRKEVIIITGRDNAGAKRVFATQPYMRIQDKIVFEKPKFCFKDGQMAGLLDYFFSELDGKLSDYLMNTDHEKN